MKTLWAPWRIQYILADKGPGCIFCRMPGEQKDAENLILCRWRHSYVVMNLYPYNCGHLMVVPYFHTSSFDGLGKAVLNEMMALTKYSSECLMEVMSPEGINVGINIGRAAGAGIEEHLHIHLVPRWVGDSSFMAVMDEIRTLPEHLKATYQKLHPAFNRYA
jgi:ATP adenylyltransferase